MVATGLARRVFRRLAQAEVCEPDPHHRDDLQIAKLIVLHAARGDAVLCSPHVLASYEVLGLHPEKVWPAIQARRKALGPLSAVWEAPPRKPAQAVSLWSENTNGARAVNSYAGGTGDSRDYRTGPPNMAAPSIAALYPNPDEQSSAKKRQFTYEQWLDIVRHSYVREAVRRATLNALTARGPWPGEDGPANGIITVSFDGMALGDRFGDGPCHRRTAQRRAKIACDEKYWTRLHTYNRWLECPKCGASRKFATCEKCGHRGRSRNRDGSTNTKEFCRPYTYEIHLEKFLTAPPPKYIRQFCARTWKEHKAAAKRGEHPNVTEMPRKPAQPEPPEPPPTKAAPKPEPAQQPAAAEHRGIARPEPKPAQPKLTRRECAKFVANLEQRKRGRTSYFSRADGLMIALHPGDEGYALPMPGKAAFEAECAQWRRDPDVVRYALKFWGYQLQE